MSQGNTLIDSSAWIEALRADGDPVMKSRVFELISEGGAVLCDMVLLELWNGARGTSEHRMLGSIKGELEVVPTTDAVWKLATELARKLRRKGVTVPASDVLIAACARHYSLELVHADGHYDQIAKIF